jgi:8-hydroxy-5-deazaflavin:NADPH oxidoreductase
MSVPAKRPQTAKAAVCATFLAPAGRGVQMSRMIAILGGTGPLGSGLALRWVRAGETVVIGSRDAERAQTCAGQILERIRSASPPSKLEPPYSLSGADNASALAAADVVVLAVPFEGHASLLKKLRPSFKPNTVLIDATVPLATSVGGRATRTLGLWQGSAAQQAAELTPQGVAVAAAFQNLSAELLGGDAAMDCDVIVCSDDPGARKVAAELAEKIPGVRAIDGGNLENARTLEHITALLITLNIKHRVHTAGLRITGLPIAKPE